MKKIFFLISVFVFMLNLSGYAGKNSINAEYIRTRYPEIYKQIFEAGKRAALSRKNKQTETVKKITKKNRANYPEWWNHSSLKTNFSKNKFLYHFDVSYSYADIDGNTEGFSSRGKGNAYIRRNRFTNHTTAIISRRKITEGHNHNNVDYKLVEDFLTYDLSKIFYIQAGGAWEKDSPKAVNNRITLLAGVGAYIFDTEKLNLNVLIGGGWQKEDYQPVIDYYFDFSSRDSYIYYFYETFNWFIKNNLVLRHGFRAIKTTENYEYFGVDSNGNLYLKSKKSKEL